MKDINKLLLVLAVAALCMILLIPAVFAETSDASGSSTGDTSSGGASTSSVGSDSSDDGSSEAPVGGSSSVTSGSSSNSSVVSTHNSAVTSATATSSKAPSTTSKVTNSRVNVNGATDDGIDTSGWSTGDGTSVLQSAGTQSDKGGSKKMLNVAKIIWILIWIPILLIVGSVYALIHVNRKSFMAGTTGAGKKGATSAKKKKGRPEKVKDSHVYRPRD